MNESFEIFLVCAPGLEHLLLEEAQDLGFPTPEMQSGGIAFTGGWQDVWRANLMCRGATRVLARVGSFRVFHLAQLDKRSKKFDWASVLPTDTPVKVEVTCRKSKIYHSKAAHQRIASALTANGFTVSDTADLVIKARIQDDLCSFSIDTSGESLHKRGHKRAVNKAPMRETWAALFLRECGFSGDEPVYDPMCGSGTFVIEAAEISVRLNAGRSRQFAFEKLPSFDAAAYQKLAGENSPVSSLFTFYGSDRDAGAIRMSTENAKTASVSQNTNFDMKPISDISAPDGPTGLVIVNPPYGERIGNKKMLYGLYAALGERLKAEFKGWRVGLITTDADLANTTKLPFKAPGSFVNHGGLRVRLWQTDAI